MRKPRIAILGAALFFLSGTVTYAGTEAAANDFYKGKTIRFVVGFSPGGGFDLYTRLIARHFGKHVAGNPGVIVQNMPGAGSMIAANYLYNVAKPDVTIGNWIGPVVLQHVIGNPTAKLDGRKFGWLGAPTPDTNICFVRDGAGIKSVKEWFASDRPLVFGATAPGGATHGVSSLLKAALELPMQIISGYPGTSAIRAAIMRDELDGGCWNWESLRASSLEKFQTGKYIALIHLTAERHPELKEVPVAMEYAATDRAREILRLAGVAFSTGQRPYTVPPATSPERLTILQKAFMDTLNDPELRADAQRAGLQIFPVDGPTIARLMIELYEIKPQVREAVKEIFLSRK